MITEIKQSRKAYGTYIGNELLDEGKQHIIGANEVLRFERETTAYVEPDRCVQTFTASPYVHIFAEFGDPVIEELVALMVVGRHLGQYIAIVRTLTHQRAQISDVLQHIPFG